MTETLAVGLAAAGAVVLLHPQSQAAVRSSLPTKPKPSNWKNPNAGLLERVAKRHALDPKLLAALVQTESSGNPKATLFEKSFHDRYVKGKSTSHLPAMRRAGWTDEQISTSYGLCQVTGYNCWAMGFRGRPGELLQAEKSLEYGARFLKARLVRWGRDERLALIAYNGGDGAARAVKAGGRHAAERYAEKVLAQKERLR